MIYSKKNRDKVVVNIDKKNRRVVHYAKDFDIKNKIYYMYLQALISQFTIIHLDLKSLRNKDLLSTIFNYDKL